MSSKTAIVILAAGRGTRMKSDLPKVLHPLAGKPLLVHLLQTIQSLAAKAHTFVVTGFGATQVEQTLKDTGFSDLTYVHQSEQLGTGHAMQQVIAHFDAHALSFDRTLILVGDTPLISKATLEKLLKTPESSIGLLTATLENPTGLGRIVRDIENRVTGIVEEKDASPSEKEMDEINTGLMLVPTEHLKCWLSQLTSHNAQGEYYLTDIFTKAFEDNVPIITIEASPSEIASVNDKVQLSILERNFQKQQAEALMRQGVTIIDPARFDLRGTLTVGCDVVIDVDVIIEGDVTFGDGCHIGPYTMIKNSQLGHGVQMKAHCHIEGASIGSHAIVGPFARLRPGAELESEVHIGNFVEVKKSKIGKGSKANHLTYLGDAIVGSNVNIGAGTITANYDGANKWTTTIEDEASTGANTVLIAPVKVCKGATIGAGSVITKEAPEGELTLSRVKQETIKGWKKPEKK